MGSRSTTGRLIDGRPCKSRNGGTSVRRSRRWRAVDEKAAPSPPLAPPSCVSSVVAAKRLELLKETLGRGPQVAVLSNPQAPHSVVEWCETRAAARTLGLPPHSLQVRDPSEFDAAFATATGARAVEQPT